MPYVRQHRSRGTWWAARSWPSRTTMDGRLSCFLYTVERVCPEFRLIQCSSSTVAGCRSSTMRLTRSSKPLPAKSKISNFFLFNRNWEEINVDGGGIWCFNFQTNLIFSIHSYHYVFRIDDSSYYLYRLLLNDNGDRGRRARVFLDLVLDDELALPKQFQLVLLHLGFQTFVLYQNLTFEQIGRRKRYSWLQLFHQNKYRYSSYVSFFFFFFSSIIENSYLPSRLCNLIERYSINIIEINIFR